MSDEALRLEQQLTLHCRFAAGTYATRFFTALKNEARVLATACPNGHTLVPPRPVCGLCNVPTEDWVDVGPGATLAGFTVVYIPFIDPMTGEERPVPYGFGLVRFTGADTNIYHLIDETDPEKLKIGLDLEPVFRPPEEREGTLADIRFFRPAAEEGSETA